MSYYTGRRSLGGLLASIGLLLFGSVIGTTADAQPNEEEPVSREPSISCDAPADQCRIARRAISSIPYPWSVLGYEVVIASPPDSWHAAEIDHDARRINLYVDRTSKADGIARDFAHELGHAIFRSCGEGRLEVWRNSRGLPRAVPDTVDAPHDFDSVSEDAAEGFAQYLVGAPSRSTVGGKATDDWLRDNADLFALCRD